MFTMEDIFRIDNLRGVHRLPTKSILLKKTFRKTNGKQFSSIYFYRCIYDRICDDVRYVCIVYIASSQSCLTKIMVFLVSVLLTNAIRSRLIFAFFIIFSLAISLSRSITPTLAKNTSFIVDRHRGNIGRILYMYVCMCAFIKHLPA